MRLQISGFRFAGGLAAALCAVLALAPAALAQSGAPANGEWPTYGGDLGSTKYSPLDQINRSNFGRLQVAWRWKSADGLLSMRTPDGGEWHASSRLIFEELNREPPFTMPDGRKVLRRHHILARDYFRQTQDVELIYRVTNPEGGEERLVHRFTMRYLFRFEAEHLLARSGFEVENVYADFDKSPYGSKFPGDLIFVARKR